MSIPLTPDISFRRPGVSVVLTLLFDLNTNRREGYDGREEGKGWA